MLDSGFPLTVLFGERGDNGNDVTDPREQWPKRFPIQYPANGKANNGCSLF